LCWIFTESCLKKPKPEQTKEDIGNNNALGVQIKDNALGVQIKDNALGLQIKRIYVSII